SRASSKKRKELSYTERSSYPVVLHSSVHAILPFRRRRMPKVTVQDKTFEVEIGERLVLALERNGIPLGHRCGGQARCTTCRVQFVSGEPDTMTEAEFNRLTQRELLGKARLSCQIEVNHDMSVIPLVLIPDNPQWE